MTRSTAPGRSRLLWTVLPPVGALAVGLAAW
jgi:hypothetical protein